MKNVEGQNNDRSFISTQKRSSRFVLQVNRGSNADPAQVQRGMPFEFCFSTDLHSICFVRALEKSFWTDVFDALKGTWDSCLLGEPVCLCLVPASASLAVPPYAAMPDMSGFWIRRSTLEAENRRSKVGDGEVSTNCGFEDFRRFKIGRILRFSNSKEKPCFTFEFRPWKIDKLPFICDRRFSISKVEERQCSFPDRDGPITPSHLIFSKQKIGAKTAIDPMVA